MDRLGSRCLLAGLVRQRHVAAFVSDKRSQILTLVSLTYLHPRFTYDVKWLPTKYRGVVFRSRLEARWAAYFDLLGLPWQYEPKAFRLPSGTYLPDFYLPAPYDFFVEVKPTRAAVEEARLVELSASEKRPVFCVCGNPSTLPQLAYFWVGEEHVAEAAAAYAEAGIPLPHERAARAGVEVGLAIFCAYAFRQKGWKEP